ncbi:TLC domain-containing protein [Mycena epipterygia]|nr:TLC domain-containing protein [Mycena epipterygia]
MLAFAQDLSPYLTPFLVLSHPTDTPAEPDSFPASAYYNTGPKDVCLLITCIAVMAILRDVLRLGVFEPFARWKLARDMASVIRFAEQGWSAAYYPLQWAFGLYVNYYLPTRIFDLTDLWRDYPHTPLAAPVKFYYLTQTAFYMHQMLILNAEAPRKDHCQMMSHHVITVFLMVATYYFNFTRVGCLIMFLMDFCDIFLPIAKMMHYLNVSQIVCDSTFALFLVSWFVTRHIMFIPVIISTYTDLPRLVPFEWSPHLGRFLSKPYWVIFCACVTALQILQVLWLGTMSRIALRIVTTGEKASDDRSDEEGEDADDDADKKKNQ